MQENADLDSGSPVGPVFTAMADAAHARKKRRAARPIARGRRPDDAEPHVSGDTGQAAAAPPDVAPLATPIRARVFMATPGLRESLGNSASRRP